MWREVIWREGTLAETKKGELRWSRQRRGRQRGSGEEGSGKTARQTASGPGVQLSCLCGPRCSLVRSERIPRCALQPPARPPQVGTAQLLMNAAIELQGGCARCLLAMILERAGRDGRERTQSAGRGASYETTSRGKGKTRRCVLVAEESSAVLYDGQM